MKCLPSGILFLACFVSLFLRRNDLQIVSDVLRRFQHILRENTIPLGGIVHKNISKLMIPTPQSPQHSAKYSGKSPYFGRFESELTCSVRSLLTYFEKYS